MRPIATRLQLSRKARSAGDLDKTPPCKSHTEDRCAQQHSCYRHVQGHLGMTFVVRIATPRQMWHWC